MTPELLSAAVLTLILTVIPAMKTQRMEFLPMVHLVLETGSTIIGTKQHFPLTDPGLSATAVLGENIRPLVYRTGLTPINDGLMALHLALPLLPQMVMSEPLIFSANRTLSIMGCENDNEIPLRTALAIELLLLIMNEKPEDRPSEKVILTGAP